MTSADWDKKVEETEMYLGEKEDIEKINHFLNHRQDSHSETSRSIKRLIDSYWELKYQYVVGNIDMDVTFDYD